MFITRKPPIGEQDDYDSENSRILDELPSSSKRRRRDDGRGGGGEGRLRSRVQARSTIVGGTKGEIKVKRSCDPG